MHKIKEIADPKDSGQKQQKVPSEMMGTFMTLTMAIITQFWNTSSHQ